MKKFLYITTILLSVAAIIFGHIHWKNKISNTIVSANDEVSADENENQAAESTDNEDTEDEQQQRNIDELTKNLTDEAAAVVKAAVKAGESVEVAVIGSGAQKMGSNPWPGLVQAGLDEAYGEGVFLIQNHSFGDQFSIHARVEQRMYDIIEGKPDMVLLEPFLMNDNGDVNPEHSIGSVRILKRSFEDANEDIIFMVQPPHPIYQPTVYGTQVSMLQEYAEENGVTYLDHWENWPDTDDEEIKKYLVELEGPNDEGNKLWAEYIINYFTGK
ncbi:SGNH/GDSL hydrolase family protein [Pseudalkalibacillus sp. SCS-8]|uniref:SGNH/GDSL hydrolase family protein n=1 Tax=Pseudalkalibacillus nanhaiensis TaxID=3115291 RepID=UPI0032D9C2C7